LRILGFGDSEKTQTANKFSKPLQKKRKKRKKLRLFLTTKLLIRSNFSDGFKDVGVGLQRYTVVDPVFTNIVLRFYSGARQQKVSGPRTTDDVTDHKTLIKSTGISVINGSTGLYDM